MLSSKPTNGEPGSVGSEAQGRFAGGVLLLAALLTIIAMAHHPTGHDAGTSGGGMTLGGFIHATMIILLAANLWGLIVFSARQGLGAWMIAGVVAYATSFVGHLLAAVINGFIVPAVAAGVDHAKSGDLFVLLWESNQAFATLGVYMASAAFLIWSVWLLRGKETGNRIVGGLGLLVGIAPAGALLAGAISMNVHGALLVYGAHAIWIGAVGVQLLRRAL